MSFTVGNLGYRSWMVELKPVQFSPKAFLFLCPSHVISKPTETELDNNLNTETNKSETSHTSTATHYCTNKLKQTSTPPSSNRSFNNPITP